MKAARAVRRLAFQTYWRLTRPMTLGVRGVVTDAGGRVLLVRHTYIDGWYLPGGGVESRETASVALTRELAEETGLVAEGDPVLLGLYANFREFKNDHVLVFRVPDWSGPLRPAPGEISEAGFFDPLAPPDGATPGTRRRLAEVFDGVAPSDQW